MAENPISCLRNRMEILLERKKHLLIMLNECENELNGSSPSRSRTSMSFASSAHPGPHIAF